MIFLLFLSKNKLLSFLDIFFYKNVRA